jgi:hypothetical protein
MIDSPMNRCRFLFRADLQYRQRIDGLTIENPITV